MSDGTGGHSSTSARLDGPGPGMVLRTWLHAEGFGASAASARPVIGVCASPSELNPCDAGLRELAEAVKRGVLIAGGLPLEFPTISIGENFVRPTSMLLRNLLAMDVEEMVTRTPIDGVVFLGGCDKTLPGQLMGAASAGKPALVVPAGPRLESAFGGRPLVTDDFWTLAAQRAATTMAVVAEALGMALPGAALLPAVDARRRQLAEHTGRAAVEAVRSGMTPGRVMTAAALDNALRAVLAIAGSTNAIIHLEAIAGRFGLRVGLDHVAELAASTPVLADVRPSGPRLLSELAAAGGVPTLLRALGPLLRRDAVHVAGATMGEIVDEAPEPDGQVIRTPADPVRAGGGLTVLRGTLAPRGAVIKSSAASPELWSHTGPALVFRNPADLAARIHDPDLPVTADSVLVLRDAGPCGGPGMPEAGGIPIPAKLYASGVRDLVRVSDARMSGTQAGTIVLHVTPESAVGGPLGLVCDGDLVRLDIAAGTVDLLVDEPELARRRGDRTPARPAATRGYEALYVAHVLQADEGCDFDFLRATGTVSTQATDREEEMA
jgi:dihydroxy-acid dehydratase